MRHGLYGIWLSHVGLGGTGLESPHKEFDFLMRSLHSFTRAVGEVGRKVSYFNMRSRTMIQNLAINAFRLRLSF